MFSGVLRKLSGWIGFIANLIFYIPCMIRDFIKEVTNEYNNSSTTILTLFILEILLIIMYFFIVPLINKNSHPESVVLLDDPVMLNTQLELENKIPDKKNANFGLSMWIYLNSMDNTNLGYAKVTTIFDYFVPDTANGTEKRSHIKISYSNIDSGNNDFIMTIGDEKFNISLPLQKWNNFVINYVEFADIETSTNEDAAKSTEQKNQLLRSIR
jgi:hypothetical protein